MRAKTCSTRARTLRWEVLCSSFRAGASVAAICDHCCVAHGILGSGRFPRRAVVAVARQWPANGDDEPEVGVDGDLVVGGVAIVLRLLRHLVVAGGDEGAVHNQHGVLAEPLAQRQIRPPVGGDQEHTVLQRQAPRSARAHRIRALAP